jgi:hypothetical protein
LFIVTASDLSNPEEVCSDRVQGLTPDRAHQR